MAPRASWKGFLKIGELTCSVALHAAASTADRVRFHTINRSTGHRVQRQFVDQETGKVVAADDQVKGYEISKGEYVVLEPEEVSAVVPAADKTLAVEAFVKIGDVENAYLDRPYYLTPADEVSLEAYGLIRDGLEKRQVAALGRTLLFRKVRSVLIRSFGRGLLATTLSFDHEVRPAESVFDDVKATAIADDMLDLARHIISTKRGKFEPAEFEDRYEMALAELVKAKIAGRTLEKHAEPAPTNVVSLMDALRQSAGAAGKPSPGEKTRVKRARKKTAVKTKAPAAGPPRRKAG